MITVSPKVFDRYGIGTNSCIKAVQDAREFMYDGTKEPIDGRGISLINALTGGEYSVEQLIDDEIPEAVRVDYELMLTQAIVDKLVRNLGFPVDMTQAISEAQRRAKHLLFSPEHKWMFAKPMRAARDGADVQVTPDVEVKVPVNKEGKIKKGGKEILAAELYKKYVGELNGQPYVNQDFIAILVKSLGMTKAGATTYNYNMKKKFGGQIEAKKK